MIIIDDFLEITYPELKKYSKTCEFKDQVNPTDGVIYPNICADIPEKVLNELHWFLGAVIGKKIKDPTIFMRMSPKSVHCPHVFHNDESMGKFSMMLYLEDRDDAGTALAKHKRSGAIRPTPDILQNVIEDQNKHEEWFLYDMAEMKENRAVIFDSSLFHCALPFGGYGETQEDSRIVLTCFFS